MNIPKKNPDPKNHHYNPKFLLEGFCAENSPRLFVYDLEKEEIRNQIPQDVACEGNFYSLLINGKLDKQLEKEFGDIESKAAPVIENFKKSLPLTEPEKKDLAKFIALARIRTPCFLDNLGALKISFEEAQKFGEKPNIEFTQLRRREIKRDIVLQEPFIRWYFTYLENKILNLKWALFKAPQRKIFITSDNPLCSMIDPSSHNGDGIGLVNEFENPGTRISLPLSKEFCWVGYLTPEKEGLYAANAEWVKSLNRNRAIWAYKYIYASSCDKSILNLGKKYGYNPFDLNLLDKQPEFVLPEVKVTRVKL